MRGDAQFRDREVVHAAGCVALFFLGAIGSMACSDEVDTASGGAGTSQSTGSSDTTTGQGAGGSSCLPTVDLIVREDALGPYRIYAKAVYRGEDVALLVDTGSQVTFLSTPPGTPDQRDYDEIEIACEKRSVMGRAFSAAEESTEAGLPVVGFLGADYFQESLTRLDLRSAQLTKIAAEEIASDATAVPYTDYYGFMFVDVTIDDTPLRLGFDTGATHSLWIGVNGQPGDLEVPTVDGFGNPITLFLGQGNLKFGPAAAAEVPLFRILMHASIEASNADIGVDAQGLFGLTSVPGRSFVVDAAMTRIWFEP